MRVHVLKSVEVSLERYQLLMEFIGSVPGAITFIATEYVPSFEFDEKEIRIIESGEKEQLDDVDFPDISVNESTVSSSIISSKFNRESILERYFRPESLDVFTWDTLFQKCNDYRERMDIGDEEFVVLITDNGNEYNWFTGPDPTGARNLFVQSSGWGFFTEGQSKYPVAYHLAAAILRYLMVSNMNEMSTVVHQAPRGCMNDFCKEKAEVMFKMRTGDVCPDCLRLISDKKINPSWVTQIFGIMEATRTHLLFRDRFEVTQRVSRLIIKGIRKDMYLADFANAPIKFTPLEKTVYLFFLNHPEGVEFSRVQDYYEEIKGIYAELAPTKTEEEIVKSAEALCNPLESSLSEKVSKIRSKLISLVGERMAEYYVIAGSNSSPKRIGLDRELVEVSN